MNPDVLIIDEVFAVGDMYFQKKCVDKIYDFKKRNKTILFCSHSLYDVRQLCDEAIWLNEGEVMAQGDSVFVTMLARPVNSRWNPAPSSSKLATRPLMR